MSLSQWLSMWQAELFIPSEQGEYISTKTVFKVLRFMSSVISSATHINKGWCACLPTVNQQSAWPHGSRVGLFLCSANAYISLRKAKTTSNISLYSIHPALLCSGPTTHGHIPGTVPLARISFVEVAKDHFLCFLTFSQQGSHTDFGANIEKGIIWSSYSF